jgi:hypothetical protein
MVHSSLSIFLKGILEINGLDFDQESIGEAIGLSIRSGMKRGGNKAGSTAPNVSDKPPLQARRVSISKAGGF